MRIAWLTLSILDTHLMLYQLDTASVTVMRFCEDNRGESSFSGSHTTGSMLQSTSNGTSLRLDAVGLLALRTWSSEAGQASESAPNTAGRFSAILTCGLAANSSLFSSIWAIDVITSTRALEHSQDRLLDSVVSGALHEARRWSRTPKRALSSKFVDPDVELEVETGTRVSGERTKTLTREGRKSKLHHLCGQAVLSDRTTAYRLLCRSILASQDPTSSASYLLKASKGFAGTTSQSATQSKLLYVP